MKIALTAVAFLGMLLTALGDSPTFLNLPSASVGTSLVGASPKQPERDGILRGMALIPAAKVVRRIQRLTAPPEAVPDARWIALSGGYFALIDADDYAYLSGFTWTTVQPKCNTLYAACHRRIHRKLQMFYLHRVILNAPSSLQVDHIDGNGLNCRRQNLRLCSLRQNHHNMRTPQRPKTSQFKGVSFDAKRGLWCAQLTHHGRNLHLGVFASEVEAAAAYDARAIALWGEFARPNFPCG